jgi:cytochrome c-type biogenesis protein CcsB
MTFPVCFQRWAVQLAGFFVLALGLSTLAIWGYHGQLDAALQTPWLTYGLSSQAAVFWMSVSLLISWVFYGLYALGQVGQGGHDMRAARIGRWATGWAWSAVIWAWVATFVRWHESYLVGPGVGHVPVSNLYEVFILFVWLTTLIYLGFEHRYRTKGLGVWVLGVVWAALAFVWWYALSRQAQTITPLIPALQSWWMKVHVPANFVGYGCFALAAMVALAYLLQDFVRLELTQNSTHQKESRSRWALVRLGGLAWVLFSLPIWLRIQQMADLALFTQVGPVLYLLAVTLWVGGLLLGRRRVVARLPQPRVLEAWMYQAIALGFAFFTLATILGALWAAEAWGGYWSWDPKETWALIVWLNYAAWLHLRLLKAWRGTYLAWWALGGLALTSFAFLGVNLWLSGLHSYGAL